MANLQKLMATQDFQSADEVNAFLQRRLQEHGGQLPEFEPEAPLELAQALVAQAYELTAPKRKRELARQALTLSADCADAYALLAELESVPLQKLELLEQAVVAGRRALGEGEPTRATAPVREKPMPRELPRFIGVGDLNEAVEYVAFAQDAWRHSSGALLWLGKQSQA